MDYGNYPFQTLADIQGMGVLGGQPQPAAPWVGNYAAAAPPAPRPGPLSGLLDPQYMLPIAAKVIGGRTFRDSLAGGLEAAGPGIAQMRKRKVLNDLLKAKSFGGELSPETRAYMEENPDFAQAVIASQLTPKNPVAVGAGERLWDPATRKFMDDGSGGAGAYGGTSMDAQNWNIILKGKNDTPEYAAAYNQLFETPKMAPGQGPNGEITQTPYYPPVPKGVKPPAGQAQPMGPQSGAAPAGQEQPGAVRTGPSIAIGQKKPIEAEIKGRTLLANAKPDYEKAKKTFDALSGTGDQLLNELPFNAGRFFQSNDYQVATDATANVVQSYIYAVSGAQAPEQEVARNMAMVMPTVRDGAPAIAAKKRRLDGMMRAIEERANLPDDGQPHPELSVDAGVGNQPSEGDRQSTGKGLPPGEYEWHPQ